jgi:tetratricopeptide (TPR) repeat protein
MVQTIRNFIKVLLAAATLASAGPVLTNCAALENRLEERRLSYNTIAHELLDVEIGLGVTEADYQTLDNIIDEAKKRISEKPDYTKKEAISILKTIDEIIDGKGFAKKENDLLNQGFKNKKLDCDNRTSIYLGIADELNLPLKAVDAPRHAFIRWHKDRETYFNWETMSAKEQPDSHYINRFNIPEISIKNGALLKSLSREETYSSAYNIRGIAFAELKQYSKALKNYNKALEFNPKNPSTHHNKGIVLNNLGKYEEALTSINKALELNPNYASAYRIKGNIFLDSKRYNKALESYDNALDAYDQAIAANKKSVTLYHKKSNAYNNKGVVLSKLKRYEEAIECYDQALELNPGSTISIKNKELALEKL